MADQLRQASPAPATGPDGPVSRPSGSIDRHATWRIAITILAMTFFGCSSSSDSHLRDVVIAGQTFHLEVAADDASRIQGLSDRPTIPTDGGMIFAFKRASVHQFVMRRCPNPIDIIYLDPNGRVVQTHEMLPEPPDTTEEQLFRYSSVWPAQFAIELRGGTVKHLKIENGQQIPLPLDDLKRMAR